MVDDQLKLPRVSIVVIGRNEAENLPACIESIQNINYPQDRLEIIYVDTNSSDGSPEIARSLGVKVFEEHADSPCPSIARNRGLQEAKYDVIYFIDADMTISSDYLREAVTYLGKKQIVCVIGRLVEREADENWISKVLATDWKKKQAGFVNAPGAGGAFIKEILSEIGGYNSKLPVGEETDLGLRLQRLGYRILLLDSVMGTHDYGVKDIRSLIGRFFRLGKNFGLIMISPITPRIMKKPGYKLLLQGGAGFATALFFLLYGLWQWFLISIAIIPFFLIGYVILRYRQVIFSQGAGRHAFLYFYLAYIMKPILFAGLVSSLGQVLVHKKKVCS